MQNNRTRLVSIVEDDQSVREATAGLVRANGFRAESFTSATEFLNSPHVNKTSCLILDVRMPGMSGLQLQLHLAAENRPIPIVFITAHGNPKMRAVAMRAGAIDFLSKPFSEEALLSAIRRALAVSS